MQPLQSETVMRHPKHTHFISLNMENHLHHLYVKGYKVMPLTRPIYPYNPVTRPEGRLNYVVVSCKCRLVLAYDKIGVASQNYCTTVQYS